MVNPSLISGVRKFGRSVMYRKRHLHEKKDKIEAAKNAKGVKTEKPKTPAPFSANPTINRIPKRLPRNNFRRPTKLRSSITPGTVLIVLAGRFRGRRVVFLKQLSSGLLLVTGPFNINGVPLRRVNQAYVIATSTKVDLSGVSVPKNVDDSYFARETGRGKNSVPQKKKETQESVDKAVSECVYKTPLLRSYLRAKFTLRNGDKPHDIKF